MQVVASPPSPSSPPSTPCDELIRDLAQRIKANRVLLAANADRSRMARSEAETSRARSAALRNEVQVGLDRLAGPLVAGQQVERTPAETRYRVTTRYRPARPPDAIDTARKAAHRSYAETRSPRERAELMESYDGFARSLASKFRHRESMDDLVQVARIGLLHAIDRFDPAMGRPFPLFARVTITGELKRHLRDRTWAMRVPRSLQEDYLNVMRAVEDLTGERSDSPSMEAVAERCGLTLDRVIEAMELRVSQRAVSIDAPANPGSDQPGLDLGAEDLGFAQLENRELVLQLLGRLPERDRRILELRFMHEMTQAEIAAEIGVSQMCVSRVLARTLGRLRLWARTAAA